MAAGPVWEKRAVRVLLGVFAAVEINLLGRAAFIGQDFEYQTARTRSLWEHPETWFTLDRTTRPMLYWIGSACHWLTRGDFTWELASLSFVLCTVLALWLLHCSTHRFIRSPGLRVAALAFVAFLPVTLVTTVVYAADALVPLPFALAAWSLLRSVEVPTTRATAGYAGLTGLALSVGNLVKFTFIALPLGVVAVLVLSWRWGRLSWQRALIIGALAAVAPTFLGSWIHLKALQAPANTYAIATFNWHGTGEMTWSSLLLVKRSDARILDAPGYWDKAVVNGARVFPLLIPNSYSYPALLHLGVFSDVLGFANQAGNGAPRPERPRLLSRIAVRLGLAFSVLIFFATVLYGGRTLIAVLHAPLAPATGVIVWGILALAWYLPLVLTLPYIDKVYAWGYWLPRLVLPALWGFALIFFSAADELFVNHPRAARLLIGLVFVEMAVHIGSVWY